MSKFRVIHYERGDYGYQITIFEPSSAYPMWQISTNDDEFPGLFAYRTEAELDERIKLILSTAECWEEE